MKVLFVCIHNSARSQMAETFLNDFGKGKYSALSAGIEPESLNPFVVKVMNEIGYDLSNNETTSVFDLHSKNIKFDYIVTVCDKEAAEKCPIFPGKAIRLNWGFKDPSSYKGNDKDKLEFTREIRDQIKNKIIKFIGDNNKN